MEKLVMKYWDCEFCGTKKIKGIYRECANCGLPRSENTTFYLSDEIEYLTEEESKTKGKGADWVCAFCKSLNSTLDSNCKSCGASREDSTKNYFQAQEEKKRKQAEKDFKKIEYQKSLDNNDDSSKINSYTLNEPDNKLQSIPFLNKINWKWIAGGFASLLLIILVIWAMIPKTEIIEVVDCSWEYNIGIEAEELVEDSGWVLPPEAEELLYTREEIHHYDPVLDHYETRERTYTEQVLDGYDITYTYTDNGDGTATQHETKTPKYKSVTRTETYQEPIYKDVPVTQTKYYYTIF